MPFVTNQGVRIHYETFGSGPALLMHRGTFHSGADLIDTGYVDALKADHQVILLDSQSRHSAAPRAQCRVKKSA
jgi:hypothetical protein